MATKFDPIRKMVSDLEVIANKVNRFKQDTTVSSEDHVLIQLAALKAFLRRAKLNRMVTCKVGLWRKRMPLVDVIANFQGLDTKCKTGEEAGEMAKLMERTYSLIRKIMAHGLPKMSAYCPAVGVVCNGWRFQC